MGVAQLLLLISHMFPCCAVMPTANLNASRITYNNDSIFTSPQK